MNPPHLPILNNSHNISTLNSNLFSDHDINLPHSSNYFIQNVPNYRPSNPLVEEQRSFQNLMNYQIPIQNSQDVHLNNNHFNYQTSNVPSESSMPLPIDNQNSWPYSSNLNFSFQNHINTIVFANNEEIQDVIMDEDDCEISDDSPYDPEQESLLDIDYNLTKDDDIQNTVQNGSNDLDLSDKEYWNKTRDCDYRIISNLSTKPNKPLSRKKYNKFKRKRESLDFLMVKSLNEKSVDNDTELNNIDNLEFDALMSYYNKLKEELTVLNCDQSASDKIDFELRKAKSSIKVNTASNSNKPDDTEIFSDDEDSSNDEENTIKKAKNIDTSLDQISDDELERSFASSSIILNNKESPLDVTSLNNESDSNDKLELLLDSTDDDQSSKNNVDLFNENLLREQLIRTLLEKRLTHESNSVKTDIVSKDIAPILIQSIENKSPAINQPINVPKTKPKIDINKYQLVIEFSNSETETDDDDANDINSLKHDAVNNVLQIDLQPKPNKQAKTRPVKTNASINQLSNSQQEEYLKLKEEILRRESEKKEADNRMELVLMDNLRKYEMKIKESALGLRLKRNRISGLKSKMLDYKKKFNKAKHRALKLHRMYLIAVNNTKMYSVQMQIALKESTKVQQLLNTESREINRYQQICKTIGTKLVGNDYKPPSIQPQVSRHVNMKAQKILKSFNEIKDNLVNKESAAAAKFLRNRIKFLLNSPDCVDHVVPMQLCFNFNFSILKSTLFYRTGKLNIQFSDFTECRTEILSSNIDCSQLNGDNYSMKNYCSVLSHFNSYRFASHQNLDISSDFWSNAINPNEFVCVYDLFGICNDSKCQYQHQKNYIYDTNEKIIDILTYLPQLSENLNLDQYKNDPKKLKNVLVKYVQDKMGESGKKVSIGNVCKELRNEIKSQSKTSVSSFLIRSIPKELVNFSENVSIQNQQVPFDDYLYSFDMKDESFVLQLSKILDLRINNDPDFYLKNRFFAPEGLPISAQFEALLSTDPQNVQMWINLAYHYLGKYDSSENDINYCIDSALNVLTRALEQNKDNSELYEQYLFFYSNKLDLVSLNNKSSTKANLIEIKTICQKILNFCSTYRLWVCYLNLCQKLEDKEQIVMEIIEQFINNKISYDNKIDQRSLDILEIVFYKINLLGHLNKHEEAVNFFNEIFKENRLDGECSSSMQLSRLCHFITKKHRVFAWLCYIHLILYRSLPYHCFQVCRKSTFFQLSDTSPFIFDWNNISSEKDARLIEKILIRALKNCCCSDEGEVDLINPCSGEDLNSHVYCLPLRLNMAQLNKLILNYDSQNGKILDEDKSTNYFDYLSMLYSQNYQVLSNLHNLRVFDINLEIQDDKSSAIEALNQIESFHNSFNKANISEINSDGLLTDEQFSILKHQLKLNYWLALYHFKCSNFDKSKQILIKSLSYYFKDDVLSSLDDEYILQLFETILFDDQNSNELRVNSEEIKNLKFVNDKRTVKMVYLYISYLMYLNLKYLVVDSKYDEYFHKIDCVFTTVINSFSSINQTNPVNEDYKMLWINYLLFLMEFPFDENRFKFVYENFRHICVTFNSSDPMFIFHLSNAFSQLIVPSDRLYFLIEIAKLNSDNCNLLLTVINLALEQLKKETCWNFIIHIVYEKKIRLQCFEFWDIAISLSIERNDHLNTHKFFQVAISLMPYNVILWEMLKNYETSINHQKHLSQLKYFYRNTICMKHAIFDS